MLSEFNKFYDDAEKEYSDCKEFRVFLTKLAGMESGYNSYIQNKTGAPAFGYFQLMEDGNKYKNITTFAGCSIEQFRKNPVIQIIAATKLAKAFERCFDSKDRETADTLGITRWGLLGGAWLAGVGGVRKYLCNGISLNDKRWSKNSQGTDVASRIKLFNNI